MSEERLARIVAKYILIGLDIGQVWFLVWLFKPNMTTGTVWVVALLYAAIQSNIYWTVKNNAR